MGTSSELYSQYSNINKAYYDSYTEHILSTRGSTAAAYNVFNSNNIRNNSNSLSSFLLHGTTHIADVDFKWEVPSYFIFGTPKKILNSNIRTI